MLDVYASSSLSRARSSVACLSRCTPLGSQACHAHTQFGRAVAENILAFDRDFWMRLAARADTAASDADKQQLASLASSVMTLMDAMVRQTEVQLSGSGEVVQDLMRAGAEPNGEWLVPLPAERVDAIRQVRPPRIARGPALRQRAPACQAEQR